MTTLNKSVEKINSALLNLLEYSYLSDITVEDIISEAGLCRGTFYKYFYDKDDVLESMQTSFLISFKRELLLHGQIKHVAKLSTPINRQGIINIFFERNVSILRFFGQYKHFLIIMLKYEEFYSYVEKIENIYIEGFKSSIPKTIFFKNPIFALKASISFISGGIISLIKNWIAYGQKETPEEIAMLLIDMFCTQTHLL